MSCKYDHSPKLVTQEQMKRLVDELRMCGVYGGDLGVLVICLERVFRD